jgi:hypothetical protein
MVQKMQMVMGQSNNVASYLRSINQSSSGVTAQPQKPRPTALNASIIQRIHDVKPGCGSCGRKHY